MNEKRRYSAMYGLTYEVSVGGDGDCKKAYFNQPKNSYEEEWWALGFTEDAEAIANLAVNLRDELRACIVERDKARAINNDLVEALEKQRNKHCFASSGVGDCDTCRDKQNCSLRKAIQKARGEK